MKNLINVLLILLIIVILIAIFRPQTFGLKKSEEVTPLPEPVDTKPKREITPVVIPQYFLVPYQGQCRGSGNKCVPAFNQGGQDYYYANQSNGRCNYTTTRDPNCTQAPPQIPQGQV